MLNNLGVSWGVVGGVHIVQCKGEAFLRTTHKWTVNLQPLLPPMLPPHNLSNQAVGVVCVRANSGKVLAL